MADKKSKKEIPDRVGAFNKGLPFISQTTLMVGPVSRLKTQPMLC
jgi:hypothetical protein